MTFNGQGLMNLCKRASASVSLFVACTITSQAASLGSDVFEGSAKVGDEELDHVRGGFSLATNSGALQIAIGIERAVYIDGVLQVMNSLNLPLLGSGGGTDSTLPVADLVQNGSGSYLLPSSASESTGNVMTVVQNSLNNQSISNLNIINATVTGQSLLQSLALSSSLRTMLSASVR